MTKARRLSSETVSDRHSFKEEAALEVEEPRYQELLAFARRGDVKALGQLLEAEMVWLKTMVSRRCGGGLALSSATGDDLAQECALRCLSTRAPFRSRNRGEFRSWLRIIALNVFRSRLRHVGATPQARRSDGLELPPGYQRGPIPEAKQGDAVREALSDLPARPAAALLLHDLCGCEYDTISWLLDSASTQAARQMRNRALDVLRSNLAVQQCCASAGGVL